MLRSREHYCIPQVWLWFRECDCQTDPWSVVCGLSVMLMGLARSSGVRLALISVLHNLTCDMAVDMECFAYAYSLAKGMQPLQVW